MRRTRLTMLFLGFALALAVTGATVAEGGGRPLSTTLTGAAERPGPGDPDASGQAHFTLNQGQGEVCFSVSWQNVDGTISGGHIHVAPATSPGPIVVPLPGIGGQTGGSGSVSGCTSADPALIKAIRQNPSAYYVNVHSAPNFRPGAIRGQLRK